ncbi:MAG: class I adenylate-forming enzyme family protein [Aquisalimonadaceae bacterium]
MRYRPGRLNRLRFILDRSLRMSNVTERAWQAYGEAEAFATDAPLDYLGLDRRLSFGDVHRTVGRLAWVLRRNGLGRYGRVVIYKENSLDYFLFALAVIRAGGIAVPVHGGLGAADFAQYAAHCGCEMVFTDPATFNKLDAQAFPGVRTWLFTRTPVTACANSVVIEQVLNMDTPQLDASDINTHDDALIVHTSGTTGFPKGVLHSSYSLLRAVRTQMAFSPLPMGERALTAAHQNHHITFTGMLLCLMAGAWTHAAIDLTPRALLTTMQEQRVTMFFAFPDIYLNLHREGMARYDLSRMRRWISGGDAMHEIHIRACVEQGGSRIAGVPIKGSLFFQFLGTSEVGSAALTRISTRHTRTFGRCVGRPTPIGPRVKVADEHGRRLPPGQPGRLMVRGRTLFKGYWNAHDRAHGTIVDGWWWTGDIAVRDRLGRYHQLDRDVDMVATVNGPVYGLPIEEELLKCEDVGEAVIIGVANAGGSDSPVAVVHSRSGGAVDTRALLAHINARLPPRQRLAAVVDAGGPAGIPRGLTGKVLKRRLRERHANRLRASEADAA